MSRPFHKPVRIQLGRVDRDRIIVSTADAASVLLRDWPTRESARRLRAMKACLDVIKHGKPPSVARNAFIAAAKEVGAYLDDYTPADSCH
ncbi:hypothetical protein ASD50_20285 [Mesorhizobium sp. Root552]|nr:hypothetical protein ASD50_20285 [Mesorhizobium sp. Root552]